MDMQDSHQLAEQLERLAAVLEDRFDQVEARIAEVNTRLERWEELAALRLDGLERRQSDQETRLRAAGESITRLTTLTSLAQAGQAAFAVLLSAIAAYLARK